MKFQHSRNKRNIIESSPFLQFMYNVTNFGAVIFSTKKLKCYIRTSNSGVLVYVCAELGIIFFRCGQYFLVWNSMKRREKYNLFHFYTYTTVVMAVKMVCVKKERKKKTRENEKKKRIAEILFIQEYILHGTKKKALDKTLQSTYNMR